MDELPDLDRLSIAEKDAGRTMKNGSLSPRSVNRCRKISWSLKPKKSVDYTGPAESLERKGFRQFRCNCSIFCRQIAANLAAQGLQLARPFQLRF